MILLNKVYNYCLSVSILTLASPPAYAYIDPGTGALVIQALIGAMATALVTIRLWWSKLTTLVRTVFGAK